jgi:formylmethanofuran dehydrogenase subunit B
LATGHRKRFVLGNAWIDGRPVSEPEAVAAAAALIGSSRLPVVTGLVTDFAGVRAALSLARIAGAAIDHQGSAAIYPAITALRESGMMIGAPAEMRRRADRVLIVGAEVFAQSPDLPDFLFGHEPDLGTRTRGECQILWLGAPDDGADLPAASVERVACPADGIPDALAMIRAAVAGHRFGDGPIPRERAETIAAWAKAAGFGCAIFAADALDELAIEMLSGLVFDLNAETRFTSLPLFGPDQAFGAALAATWTTGFPLRVGFGRGFPEHDPDLCEAGQLIASGEADLAVHVAGLDGVDSPEPDWSGVLPVIAIGEGAAAWTNPPKIRFEAAMAGRDHDGVLHNERFGSFVPVATATNVALPRAADILSAIAAALGGATSGVAA